MTPRASISEVQELDPARLRDFFERIDANERGFFKEDVLDPDVIYFWSRASHGFRLVAAGPDGAVQGFVGVVAGTGWASHVGDLRLVVDPVFRGLGLGRQLSQRALVRALSEGMEKISVEVVAQQSPAVNLFQNLGFEAEAVLRDHVRTRDGEIQDLMILSYFARERLEEMSTLGVDRAVGLGNE